jgi:uncharacterized membrane protein HdeD (DUF308 family)
MAITPETQDGAAALTDDAQEGVRELCKLWYLFVISGVVSAGVGLLVLVYPDPSLKLLGVFLGIDLVIAGTIAIVRSISRRDGNELSEIVVGILALVAGLIVIRNPGKSLVLLAMAFAIYLVVAGAVAIARGLARREGRGVALAGGAVLVTAGVVILAWPDISLKTLAVLVGLALILQGVVEIGEGLLVRSAARLVRA